MSLKDTLIDYGSVFLLLLIIILLAYLDVLLYTLLFVLGIIVYKIWKARNFILGQFKMAEISIWGRPLEKKYWTKKSWINRPRFKLFPDSVSTSYNKYFRFAYFMFLFSLFMYIVSFFFDYYRKSTFYYLLNICGIFALLFILIEVANALRLYYERKRAKRNIRSVTKG